jgi:tetratricopeptide (TPR) repeat protein/tRNA A-37 threonylcarbamoyl transferase component Bud32
LPDGPLDPLRIMDTLPLAPPVPAMLTMPGVQGYEVISELGRGGMGVVYRARQLKLNRVVALKMILSGEFARSEEVQRFLNEAEAVAQLEHPNIIRIYDVSEHDGRPCFAMELADAGCLADRLHGQPLPPGDAARMLETLARAMHHAHQRGIIHRDLKPVNVLLSSYGTGVDFNIGSAETTWPLAMLQPKITDFGLAKRMDSQGRTETGRVIGTVNYMAPEQAEGRSRDIGPQTDVYGLGAILYELLTGRAPFQADSIVATLELVRSREPKAVRELNPACPRDLETICLKCLEKDPARRYLSAQDLADDLSHFLAGEPIKARPVSTWERVWRGMQRRRRELIWVGSALLVILVLAVFLIHQAVVRNNQQSEARQHYQQAIDAIESTTNLLGQRDRPTDQLAPLLADLQHHYVEVQQQIDEVALREQAAQACAALGEALYREGRKDLASSACETAVRLYTALLTNRADQDAMRDALAQVRLRQSQIRADYRAYDSAEEALQTALQELETLCGERKDNLVYRRHLAEVHHKLGELYDARKKRKDAIREYLAGMEIRKKLTEADRGNREFLRDLARSHGYLGDTYLEMGDKTKAWDAYYASEVIRKELAADARDAEAQFQLGRSRSNEGYFGLLTDDPERARKAYEDARVIQQKLVAEHPEVADYKSDLGWSLMSLAELSLDRDGPSVKAKALAEEARTSYEGLVENNREDRSYVRSLARANLLLALTLRSSDEAKTETLVRRAECLLKLGKKTAQTDDPDDLYQLAVLETLNADLAGADKDSRDDHADVAMGYLDAAIRSGFTKMTRLERGVYALRLLWKEWPARMTNIVRRCREAAAPASREN